MRYLLCVAIGYLFGILNPAALISVIKHVNLRKSGTGNLGATNVMMNFGKALGVLVMLFDIAKAFFAVKLTEFLFPDLFLAGLIAGCAAVVGHIYPFYLRFRGGKGLAAYGGLILAVDPLLFLFLLIVCLIVLLVSNYVAIMVVAAAVLFPILGAVRCGSTVFFAIAAVVSALLVFKFRGNFRKIKKGTEIMVREFLFRKKI